MQTNRRVRKMQKSLQKQTAQKLYFDLVKADRNNIKLVPKKYKKQIVKKYNRTTKKNDQFHTLKKLFIHKKYITNDIYSNKMIIWKKYNRVLKNFAQHSKKVSDTTMHNIAQKYDTYYVIKSLCAFGHFDFLKKLLDYFKNNQVHFDINPEKEGYVLAACVGGHLNIVKLLHSLGADIHAKNDNPMKACCVYGREDIAKWLYYTDPIYYRNIPNILLHACTGGHVKLVKWTLSNFISNNVRNDLINFENCCDLGYYIDETTEKIIDPEWPTVNSGNYLETGKLMLDVLKQQHPDIDIHYSHFFARCCISGNIDMAKYLIETYSDKINLHFAGEAPLRNACRNNHFELVKWLSQVGRDTNSPINYHVSDELPFRTCCQHGATDILKWLCETSKLEGNPIDYKILDDRGFVVCCDFGHFDIAKYLIKHGEKNTKINIHTVNDWAFRLACENGHLNIVKFLLGLQKTYGNINFMANSCEAFRKSWKNNHKAVYKLLAQKCPVFKLRNNIATIPIYYAKRLQNMSNKPYNDTCMICFGKENIVVIFSCKHMVCFDCYSTMLDNNSPETKCPMCRCVSSQNLLRMKHVQ